MNRFTLAILVGLAVAPVAARAEDPQSNEAFAQQATWKAPTAAEVRQQLLTWLTDQKVDLAARKPVEDAWADAEKWSSSELLDRFCQGLAAGDPQAKELVALCARPRTQVVLPEFAWLADEKTPTQVRHNLRLLYGRWLTQQRMMDEALQQLDKLEPDAVVDPAGLLFYQSVVYHALLKKEAGLLAIARLLEPQHEIPRRYTSVARLMQADFEPLVDDSLDHIARRMDDIRRRLDLGRAGPKVREVEDGVIASLDKLIDELEKQAAAAAAAAAAGGQGSIRSSSPAPDSMPLGGKGPGNVTRKDIGHQSGWGDLPPKERQEALQQIGKDFPAHYRDVIEQYFRKLASEESEQK